MSLPQRSKKSKNGKKMAALAGVNSDTPKSIVSAPTMTERPHEATPVDNLQKLWNKRKAMRRTK